MGLFEVILVLIFVGVILFGVYKAPFIHPMLKTAIYWIAAVAIFIWICSLFGVIDTVNKVKVGR